LANLELSKTVDTPEEVFEEEVGVFRGEGESYPENVMEYYPSIIQTLTRHDK